MPHCAIQCTVQHLSILRRLLHGGFELRACVWVQGASKSLVLLVTELGEELKGSSEAKVISIVEDFEHQIDGLGIKVCASNSRVWGVRYLALRSCAPAQLAVGEAWC